MDEDLEALIFEESPEEELANKMKEKEKNISKDVIDNPEETTGSKLGASKDLQDLYNRLAMWHENCRDLFVDLRATNYDVTDDDILIDFVDKSYYNSKLYFKMDPQNPRDEKVIHAHKQLCKVMGIPYSFYASCRPTLKKNIFRTWKAGLADDTVKSQNVFKIRESKGCTIIRAITPVSKAIIPLHELIKIIQDTLTVPFKFDFAYGDDRDDLVLHARFLFEKEYDFNGPVCLGFAVTASELDSCPLSFDVLVYNKTSKTYSIASYGGDSYFKSDYKGLQTVSLRDIIPAMIKRLEEEAPEILDRLNKKQVSFNNSAYCVETEALEICKQKGISSKIKKAIYHQIAECLDDINSPWDLARHVGFVAKDFDAIRRIQIEKAIGLYLNLFFQKDLQTNVQE